MMDVERETTHGMHAGSYSHHWSNHSLETNQNLQTKIHNQNAFQTAQYGLDQVDHHFGIENLSQNNEKRKKRKYVKKSIEKFLKPQLQQQETALKSEDRGIGSANKLYLTPIYSHITEKIDFVLIGGDLFFKFQLSEDERDIINAFQNQEFNQYDKQNQLSLIARTPTIMKEYKEIVEIQRSDSYILVQMANKIEGLREFQNLITKLSQNTQELLGEPCVMALIELQKIMIGVNNIIEGIIKSHQNDTERLLVKQQLRVQYIEQLIKDRISSDTLLSNIPSSKDPNYVQGVYSIGFINLDFVQKIPVLRKILYSKGYMEVLGLSLDEAVNSFIRQGLKECFDLQTRMRIQQAYMKTVLSSHNSNKSIFKIEDMNLLAFDNISIKCFGEIKLLDINLPPHLRYDESNPNEIFLEQAYLIKINIPAILYGQIHNLRSNLKVGENKQDTSDLLEEQEFRYSIQSQVFIEKFYSNSNNQIQSNNNMEQETSLQHSQSQNNSHVVLNKSQQSIKSNESEEKVRSKYKML